MIQLIKTSDGSHTLFVPELDEHYHSIHGAIQESSFIFIKNGFDFCKASPIAILEIGFGTGLNALLTAVESLTGQREVRYTSIEKYPLDKTIINSLNYDKFVRAQGSGLFQNIHTCPWNETVKICPNFNLLKIKADFTEEKLKGIFNLIYFDAFGPDKQPEMWTIEMFASIAAVTARNGILVTYSAKGQVKRNLKACGFEVTLLPGPPGKRQMIRAVKI